MNEIANMKSPSDIGEGIACAPDLLGALKLCRETLVLVSRDCPCDLATAMQAARAALEKAEGGIACSECGALMPDDAYARKYGRCARHADAQKGGGE